eukprot:COSAG01_NODE_49_length_31891_cov_29.945773_33_plen_213_part_00
MCVRVWGHPTCVGVIRQARGRKEARLEEERLRKVGSRAQQREQAWQLYNRQLARVAAAARGQGGGGGGGGVAGVSTLWQVTAPQATVCDMGEAAAEVLSHCSAIAPMRKVKGGKLVRDQLVVVGLAGAAGAGKSTLARCLERSAEALVVPLSPAYLRKDNLGQLEVRPARPAAGSGALWQSPPMLSLPGHESGHREDTVWGGGRAGGACAWL